MDISSALFHENSRAHSADMDFSSGNFLLAIHELLKESSGATEGAILSGLQVAQTSPVGMKVGIGPGVAINPEDGTVLSLSASAEVVVTNGDAQARIDTLQAKAILTSYDPKYRAILGAGISYQSKNTKQKYVVQLQVLPGTLGSGVAPVKTAGWVKLAEIAVGANQSTSILNADIKNCTAEANSLETPDWTTEKGATCYLGSIETLKNKLNTHELTTSGIHGATSEATPDRIIIRDANGRAKVSAPVDDNDIIRKNEIDEFQADIDQHAGETDVHGATSEATPDRIIIRDADGRAKVADPSESDDIATKATIDQVQDNLDNHELTTSGIHGATSEATTDRIIIRDANGRAKVSAPVDDNDMANKSHVDNSLNGTMLLGRLKTVDGTGSELDLDLWGGKHVSEVIVSAGSSFTHAEKYAAWSALSVGKLIVNKTLRQGETVTQVGAFPAFLNPTLLGRGYAMGGNTTAVSSEVDGIQFDTEVAINPAAVLVAARRYPCGMSSSIKGYVGGGWTTAVSAEIDGIQFDTEVAINPAAVLAVARYVPCGVNSAIRGYAMGGYSTVNTGEIDGLQFDTEVAVNPAAVLVTARQTGTGVNSSVKGYALGGYGGSYTTEIDGIQFSNEASTNPVASLSLARGSGFGLNSSTRGYCMGGFIPALQSIIDGIQFDTETAFTASATMSVPRGLGADVSSSIKGYALGGSTQSTGTGYGTEIDGLLFSNETAINPAAVLAVARYGMAGVQSGWY